MPGRSGWGIVFVVGRSSSLRYGALAVLVLAAALVGVSLSDCFGLGMGKGVAPATSEADPPRAEPPPPTEQKTQPRRVVVEGMRCRLEGAVRQSCDAVCKELADAPSVSIDAVAGSHKTVEDLTRCLGDAGVDAHVLSK